MHRFYSVMASTSVSESGNLSSNLGRTTFFLHHRQCVEQLSCLANFPCFYLTPSFPANMKVVVQRVRSASAVLENETIAQIRTGAVLYVGIGIGDSDCQVDWLLENIVEEVGEFLVLSQFTLFGEFRKGKPSFHRAENNQTAQKYFERVCLRMRQSFPGRVQTGVFGRELDVCLELSDTHDGVVRLIENP